MPCEQDANSWGWAGDKLAMGWQWAGNSAIGMAIYLRSFESVIAIAMENHHGVIWFMRCYHI